MSSSGHQILRQKIKKRSIVMPSAASSIGPCRTKRRGAGALLVGLLLLEFSLSGATAKMEECRPRRGSRTASRSEHLAAGLIGSSTSCVALWPPHQYGSRAPSSSRGESSEPEAVGQRRRKGERSAAEGTPSHSQAWEDMFRQLAEYKQHHGDCNIKTCTSRLGRWIVWQRGCLRQTSQRKPMLAERVARLEKLGMEWVSRDAVWEPRFRDLLEFRMHHGDSNVPRRFPENRCLGAWVSWVRQRRKAGKLPCLYLERLSNAGLDWTLWDPKQGTFHEWEGKMIFMRMSQGGMHHGGETRPRRRFPVAKSEGKMVSPSSWGSRGDCAAGASSSCPLSRMHLPDNEGASSSCTKSNQSQGGKSEFADDIEVQVNSLGSAPLQLRGGGKGGNPSKFSDSDARKAENGAGSRQTYSIKGVEKGKKRLQQGSADKSVKVDVEADSAEGGTEFRMVQNTDRVVVQEGGGEIAQDGGGEGEGDDDEWVAEHRAVAEKEGRKFVNLPLILQLAYENEVLGLQAGQYWWDGRAAVITKMNVECAKPANRRAAAQVEEGMRLARLRPGVDPGYITLVRAWGLWSLEQTSRGLFSNITMIANHTKKIDPTVSISGGPWRFERCGIKAAGGTALLTFETGRIVVIGCSVGGVSTQEETAQNYEKGKAAFGITGTDSSLSEVAGCLFSLCAGPGVRFLRVSRGEVYDCTFVGCGWEGDDGRLVQQRSVRKD